MVDGGIGVALGEGYRFIYQCAYNEKMHHIEPFIYTARNSILPLIMKDHSPHVHVATIRLQCGKDLCRQYPQDVERSGS